MLQRILGNWGQDTFRWHFPGDLGSSAPPKRLVSFGKSAIFSQSICCCVVLGLLLLSRLKFSIAKSRFLRWDNNGSEIGVTSLSRGMISTTFCNPTPCLKIFPMKIYHAFVTYVTYLYTKNRFIRKWGSNALNRKKVTRLNFQN